MSRRPRGALLPAPSHWRAGFGPAVALGARIRERREGAGLTVRGFAAAIGVSPSLISQVERGLATPSVATLWLIATELGLPVADLFSTSNVQNWQTASGVEGAPLVQRHETRQGITLDRGVRWERLTATPDSEIDFIYVVYPPGAASCGEDAFVRHGGREFGYVISGTLAVEFGFDEFVLRANDSISFDSATPHRLRAAGDEAAVAIWAVVHAHNDTVAIGT